MSPSVLLARNQNCNSSAISGESQFPFGLLYVSMILYSKTIILSCSWITGRKITNLGLV